MLIRAFDALATTALAFAFFMIVLFLLRLSAVEPTNVILLSLSFGAVALGTIAGLIAEALRARREHRERV